MLCEVTEEIKEISTNEAVRKNFDKKIGTTPEKGRVWRWSNTTSGLRKNTEGPVLRPTVKPVKRFIPELTGNSTAASNNNPQNQAVVNQKQTVSNTHNDDNLTTEVKTKRQTSSNATSNQSFQTNNNKKKRVREQWSIEDKNHFFEAVAIHGKDFEAIQKTIAQKHRKRGDESVVKTKDQVRHLFYRTWTTINKLLNHEAPANHNVKGSHELLAVINYGELRKKLGGCILKKKGILKLNELITYGSTSLRIKGKNYRIKTPSCKALKRIHDLEGAAKKASVIETRRIKLPLRVNLELHPLSMSAWNHVHLLAHNPRLRFNMPLECQLSYLLSYLSKKWQSLSAKMFNIAQVDSTCTSANEKSQPPNRLEIHVPPEVSVKAKYQVHEIVNTKTHCIVSYVVHKSGKHLSKKKKKDTEASIANAAVSVELCNSSEDEAGFVDHTSDLEEHPPHSLTPTEDLQDEDIKSVIEDLKDEELKAGTELDSDDNAVAENFLTEIGFDKDVHSPEKDVDKVVNSFFQVTEISADQTDICAPDFAESVSSNTNVALENSPDKHLMQEIADAQNESQMHEQFSIRNIDTSVSCMSPDTIGTSSQGFVPLDHAVVTDSNLCQESSTSPSLSAEFSSNVTDVAVVEDLPHTDQSDRGICNAKTDADSPVKPVPIKPIQKVWDCETVGDITLAELYLMLGKPSLFKLCYEWKEFEQEDTFLSRKEKPQNQKLSTSVTALIQYASLMLSKIQKDNAGNLLSSDYDKTISAKSNQSTGINVGVQCTLIDKSDATTNRKSISPFSNVTKKSHNRGVKRISDNDTTNDNFVVPNIPARRKRNQSSFTTKTMMSSMDGIAQGGQVRLSDVEFRKQMEALNRRIDLFRTKSRNRGARKPYIVQRAMMPHDKSVRKMMTLSIDSLGANRVGFLPVTNQALSNTEPALEAVGATISISKASERNVNSSNLSDALGRKLPAATTASSGNSCQPNVLAQAAEEAGLFSNDSPSKDTTNLVKDMMDPSSTRDEVAASTSKESFSYSRASIITLPVEDNDELLSSDTEQPSMIKNDVTLPIRPPTPSVDSLSGLFDFGAASVISIPSQNLDGSERNTPVLSMPMLDLPITPQKSSTSPIHPWSINCNSRDGLSSFATLNTPQRILLSDAEDSVDSLLFSLTKQSSVGGANASGDDADSSLQTQYLVNDDSVDFNAKFQHLMQTAAEEVDVTCKSTNDVQGTSKKEEG